MFSKIVRLFARRWSAAALARELGAVFSYRVICSDLWTVVIIAEGVPLAEIVIRPDGREAQIYLAAECYPDTAICLYQTICALIPIRVGSLFRAAPIVTDGAHVH